MTNPSGRNAEKAEAERLAAAAGTSRQPSGPGREKSVRTDGGEFPDRLGIRQVIFIGERVGDLEGVQ